MALTESTRRRGLGLALLGALALTAPASTQQGLAGAEPPVGVAFRPRVKKQLKVGLATDLEAVTVPCCQGAVLVQAAGQAVGSEAKLVITPRAEVTVPALYRVQVAALKDQGQAERLAGWLSQRLAQPAEAVFDAGTDLYRVRAGSYKVRREAEVAQRELRAEGLDPWIVSERGELRATGFGISRSGGTTTLSGRWLSIHRSNGEGIRIDSGAYRGRILLYLNDRGKLNVINELTLEDYLRGVVPREMGPVAYSNLEALKAQTVAARTYTVRNLGEFYEEGYDICATPRCQVFGGMDAEHPLSDQAVRETTGQVLVYRGEVADTLYSASCGGHTENVEVVFPQKHHPYLRGVPCPEGGVEPLSGTLARGTSLVDGLTDLLLANGGSGVGASAAEAKLRRLAELAGLPASRGRLESLDRADVRRFVGSLFDLVLDARLFTSGREASLLLDDPPPEWSADDLRLAAYLDRTGLLTAPFEGDLTSDELDETLFQLALYLGVLEAHEASYLSRTEGELRVKFDGEIGTLAIDPGLATFRGGEYRQRSAPLVLRPGDAMTLYLREGTLVALVQQVDPELAPGTPGATARTWRRTHSDSHLKRMVAERYPEIDLQTFEVLERGVSGRVGKIRLVGTDGKALEVEGLAVRWTLDVPDTLFTVRRITPAGREPGWLFTGRGHGHGVGMCQLGAFGMGLRGRSYRQILSHYYSDVDFADLELVDAGPVDGGAR